MKFQAGWLREHVDLPEPPAEIGRRLTSLGFALDGIEREADGDAAVLDLDVGSNRPDAMNHVGIARELAAALRRPLALPPSRLSESGEQASSAASITVDAPDLCPRYCARVIRGVKVGPSPAWMAARLEACGIRPINVVVDVTNYVLLELGHPLHAFDLDLLEGRRIVVRRARAGESLTTLDGQERPLEPDMLLIADGARGIAIAGVMGGANSEIRDETRDVLLESAVFAPSSIRRTSRLLGLHTEASHRFERGCDREMAPRAADRAASLLAELAGGTVLEGLLDVAAPAPAPKSVAVRLSRARQLTGVEIARPEAERILGSLGFRVTSAGDELIAADVPSWRGDVSREVDLVEELLRHHGFDQVPYSLPAFRDGAQPRKPWELSLRRVRETLAAAGALEAVHWAFDDAAAQVRWAMALGLDEASAPARLVELANPMAENLGAMRLSLLPSLLRTLAGALRRGEEDVRLFEVSPLYQSRAVPAGKDESPCDERPAVGLVAAGLWGPRHFLHAPPPADVLAVKGALVQALIAAGAPAGEIEIVPADIPRLAPGAAHLVLRGSRIGWIGRVHPDELRPLEIDAPVFAGEADLSLACASGPAPRRHAAQSRFPKSQRDLCVLVDRSLPLGVILNAVTAFRVSAGAGGDQARPGGLIESIDLIDRYLGAGVPEGKVSLTFSATYRRPDRTLTQDEVDASHQALLDALVREVGAQLR